MELAVMLKAALTGMALGAFITILIANRVHKKKLMMHGIESRISYEKGYYFGICEGYRRGKVDANANNYTQGVH